MSTGHSGKKGGQAKSRDERLKAALRENLRRRKAQERARGATVPAQPISPPQEDKNR